MEEILRIEELLNLDALDFTNNLGDIILDTNYSYSYGENEDNEALNTEIVIQDNGCLHKLI